MRALATLTLNDLLQGLRDKSVILFGLVVPLALMFVFNLVFGSTDDREFRPVTVAVSAPDGDQVAATVTTALESLDDIGLDVTVDRLDEASARALDTGDDVGLAMLFPDDTTADVTAGRPVTVEVLEGDSAGLEGSIVVTVVDTVLQQYARGTVAAYAGASVGIDPARLEAVAREAATGGPAYDLESAEASNEQLSAGAALVAGQAGLFLLFTVSFGVTSLLVERENGTLARLRSLPIRGGHIVLAKALVSFLTGVISTSVLLAAGGYFFDADFGSLPVVAALVVAACAAATSLMFLVVRVAATSEQASIATSIFAVVLGIGGGAFFPISTDSPVLSQVLDVNPVAALMRGLGITSGGGGIGDVTTPLVTMVAFAVVVAAVSRLVPDRGAMA